MSDKKAIKDKPKTPRQRVKVCQAEIEQALKKHGCTMLPRPNYKLRDDNTWSLVIGVEIVAKVVGQGTR